MLGLGKIELLNGAIKTNNTSGTIPTGGNHDNSNLHDVEALEESSESDDSRYTEEVSSSEEEMEETKEDKPTTTSAPPKKTWAMLVNPKLSQSEYIDHVLPSDAPTCLVGSSTGNTFPVRNGMNEEGGQFSDAEEDNVHLNTTETEGSILQASASDDFPSLTSLITSLNTMGEVTEKEQPQMKKKIYNSFSRYKDIISAKGAAIGNERKQQRHTKQENEGTEINNEIDHQPLEYAKSTSHDAKPTTVRSRIIGCEGQDEDVDEVGNGEGWINEENLPSLKASGLLLPTSHLTTTPGQSNDIVGSAEGAREPPIGCRCACATTDFAMQNIILQMGMKLLSIDGRTTVRRVKQWVSRCRACFHILYSNNSNTCGSSSSRLFCPRCGSDCLERVAASVDGRTGRVRLHFRSKAKPINLRGTKFSLPKPGRANKYEGDILLREDQLMMGAWRQKVIKGSKAVSSMFGSDISDTVGLGDLTKRDDIQVGFGRRNPNATKFGRERRGKKKKTTDKACGLRRY
jgi:RNA-binding protein NOB1